VRRVENAHAALDILEQREFDAVLSDIEMPGGVDGIELAARLGERRARLPVVLMSGYAKRIEEAHARGLEVLAKPCSPEPLRSALAAALARQQKSAAA
jgi:CheY-like chemotaxis protein